MVGESDEATETRSEKKLRLLWNFARRRLSRPPSGLREWIETFAGLAALVGFLVWITSPAGGPAKSPQPAHSEEVTTTSAATLPALTEINAQPAVTPGSEPCLETVSPLLPDLPIRTTNPLSRQLFVKEMGPFSIAVFVRKDGTQYWLKKITAADGDSIEIAVLLRNAADHVSGASVDIALTGISFDSGTLSMRNPDHPKGVELGGNSRWLPGIVGLGSMKFNETAALCFTGEYHTQFPSADSSVSASASADDSKRSATVTAVVAEGG